MRLLKEEHVKQLIRKKTGILFDDKDIEICEIYANLKPNHIDPFAVIFYNIFGLAWGSELEHIKYHDAEYCYKKELRITVSEYKELLNKADEIAEREV